MASPGLRKRAVLRGVGRIVLLALLVFAGLYVVFFFAQAGIIFQGDAAIRETPDAFGWPYEDVELAVMGETTHGWFLPVKDARGVVLFSHGNGGNISTRLGHVGRLKAYGLSVLTYDYGGYGKSTGKPSEKRVYADARAMWDYLTVKRGISPYRIILYGRSFGCGATCELAREVKPGGVVLACGFTSMADAAFREYPWFPASIFVRHRFNNVRKVSEFRAPLLVIHSQEDTLYPFEQGRELYARAPEPKQFLEVYGDHGEGPAVSPEVYDDGWREFLDRALP